MDATDKLRALLALPDPEHRDDIGCFSPDVDSDLPIFFDPWELFPSLYGCYSSAFDDMALEVLEGLMSRDFWPTTLAHEMFQEMLCTANLCDYGTSPRGCFPNYGTDFEKLLPELIAKWKAYRAVRWGG